MNERNTCKQERRLIHVPIIHTETDMGELGGSVRETALQKMGVRSWKRKVQRTEELWNRIEETLEQLDLAYECVRLYQDGLPVCGREGDIVRDLAESGSRNHRLLLRLMEKGAALMGTESPDLLLQEYREVKHMMTAKNCRKRAREDLHYQQGGKALLKKRDAFIARRINETLNPGETGILFLGMLHDLAPGLQEDIQVLDPLNLSRTR